MLKNIFSFLLIFNWTKFIEMQPISSKLITGGRMNNTEIAMYKDTPYLFFYEFVRTRTKDQPFQLNCQDEPMENLCPKYSLQTANCTNINYRKFDQPAWTCRFKFYYKEVLVKRYEIECEDPECLISMSSNYYMIGSCLMRYKLQLKSDDELAWGFVEKSLNKGFALLYLYLIISLVLMMAFWMIFHFVEACSKVECKQERYSSKSQNGFTNFVSQDDHSLEQTLHIELK